MTLRLTSRTLRRLATAAVALACLGSVSTATAQYGGRAGFDEAFRPDYLSRDVTLFAETLNLDDLQRSILENLLDDYRIAFESGVDDVKLRIQASTKDPQGMNAEDVLKKIWGPIDDWSKKKAQLKVDFMENLKVQLSPEQQERWTKLERALRREKTLDQGELQGESVDLFVLVKEMQLPPTALEELQQPMDDFEAQLDEALSKRAQILEMQKPRVLAAMQDSDSRSGVMAMESIMVARVEVRGAQDTGRDRIAEALVHAAGQAESDRFMQLALERGYPKIYRSDPILPLFDNARAVPDLTEEQNKQLANLEQQYRVEIVGVNKNLADAYRQEEPKEPRRRVEMMQARQANAAEPNAAPRPAARAAEAESIASRPPGRFARRPTSAIASS
jgi:hypothetical protein